MPNMHTYLKVTYRDGRDGSRHVVTLRDPQLVTVFGQPSITGTQVGPDGDDIKDDAITLFVVTVGEVTGRKPMEMDLHYARLVPAGTAKIPVQEKS